MTNNIKWTKIGTCWSGSELGKANAKPYKYKNEMTKSLFVIDYLTKLI